MFCVLGGSLDGGVWVILLIKHELMMSLYHIIITLNISSPQARSLNLKYIFHEKITFHVTWEEFWGINLACKHLWEADFMLNEWWNVQIGREWCWPTCDMRCPLTTGHMVSWWHGPGGDTGISGMQLVITGQCPRRRCCDNWRIPSDVLHVDIKTDHKHSPLVTVWWDAGNMEQVSSLSLIITSRTMLYAANIWHQRVDPGPGLQQLIWNIETSISVREALISILGPNICSAFWWLPRNSSFTASYLLFFGLPWE